MDVQRAKELLTILADGTDPLTGEVLPDDHVCNKGEIVRALNCAVEALSRKRKKTAAGEHRKTVDRGTGSRVVSFVRRGYEEERPLRTLWPHARRNRVPPAAAGENVKNVAPQATKPSFACATMGAQSNEGGFSL